MNNEVETILTVYRENMEEMRERRRIEWQTLIVVNAFYLSLFGGLKYLSKLPVFQAIAVTIIISVFTYIWFIRIYGNAVRFRFHQDVRNKISDSFSCSSIIQSALDAQKDLGCPGWKNKKQKCIPDWPVFGYRGICLVIILYGSVLVSALWIYRVEYRMECDDIQQFVVGGILVFFAIVFVIAGALVDRHWVQSGKA